MQGLSCSCMTQNAEKVGTARYTSNERNNGPFVSFNSYQMVMAGRLEGALGQSIFCNIGERERI